jgi:hypothetical protein
MDFVPGWGMLYIVPISHFSLLELGFLLSPSGSREAWAEFYVLSFKPMPLRTVSKSLNFHGSLLLLDSLEIQIDMCMCCL